MVLPPKKAVHMSDVVVSPSLTDAITPLAVITPFSVVTFGTTTSTAITNALINSGAMAAADVAAINNAIKDDINPAHPIYPGAYSVMDLLYIPNRGVLRVLPGDYVAVDPQGWPILVSANSIANAGVWSHG